MRLLLPLYHIPLYPLLLNHPSPQSHTPPQSPTPQSPTPIVTHPCSRRLQELEDQYRREREEATYLLEQQRLVRSALLVLRPHTMPGWGEPGPCLANSPTLHCPTPSLYGPTG